MAGKPKRKEIKERLDTIYLDGLEGTFAKVHAFFDVLEHEHRKTHSDLRLKVECSYTEYENDTLVLYGKRMETDAEYKKRIEQSRKAREAKKARESLEAQEKEQKDYEDYLRLKEKFENK